MEHWSVINVKKMLLLTVGLCLFSWLFLPTVSQGSDIEFSVETIIPDNQWDKTVTYFDLMMKPAMNQTLVIKAANPTTRDITILSQVYPATTNSNGVVEYGESNTELNQTALYNISELVTINKPELIVKANSTADIELSVAMPKEVFDGVLAGGVTISQKEETTNSAEKNQGMSISNTFNYNISIVLRETDKTVEPLVELTEVKSAQVNGKGGIIASIQNSQPVFINQVMIKAKISEASNAQAVLESQAEQMQLAPNSTLDYPVWLTDKPLKAGTYVLTIAVESKGEKWLFEETFSVSRKEAKQFKQLLLASKPLTQQPLFILGLVTVAGGCVIIGFMLKTKIKDKRRAEKCTINT